MNQHPARPPFGMALAPYQLPGYWYPAVVPMAPPQLPPPPPVVRTVWADNLDVELDALRHFAVRAHCVAVSIHYPGVVHGADRDHNLLTAEQRYAIVKSNVDALKPLQFGLAICTRDGSLAAWEFNLCDFNPGVDPCAAHSVAYLAGRGLDVDAHHRLGVPMARLTTAFRRCGLIVHRPPPGVRWITYAGAYHFGYLLKVISGGNHLPDDLTRFFMTLRRYLGEQIYDVARLASDWLDVPVGLERMATRLGLPKPLLSPHLAGARSVLTLQACVRLRLLDAQGNMHRGVLKGLQVI